MSYNLNGSVADCYPGTTCLINKFHIRNEQQLAQLEADITLAKAAILESQVVTVPLNLAFYKSIHRFLFEDLYDWAGELRTVNLSKKGTRFCPADQLKETAENCFRRLEDLNFFVNLDQAEFIDEIVDFYVTTNMLHLFREGNGRTQRIFISKLIQYNGYEIDFSNIEPDELMLATIAAAHGVTDYLKEIFQRHIFRPNSN